MEKPIQWPAGEFTIQAAVDSNPAVPQAVVRQKLAAEIAAKNIVQTKKGNHKIKGTFRVANAGGEK